MTTSPGNCQPSVQAVHPRPNQCEVYKILQIHIGCHKKSRRSISVRQNEMKTTTYLLSDRLQV